MNYRETKDFVVSELTDPINFLGASFGFCLESDLVPKPDIIFSLPDISYVAQAMYQQK